MHGHAEVLRILLVAGGERYEVVRKACQLMSEELSTEYDGRESVSSADVIESAS